MLLKSNLRLLLNQLENLSETPYFSSDLDAYIRELSVVLKTLLEKLQTSPTSINDNVAHAIQNHVWQLTQFLTGSTTKRIPYEVTYAIQKAASEWSSNKLLITTAIIQEANFYFHSSNKALFDLVETELGVKISHQPVQIALPHIYRHKPLFCVPLFHELGHFIDSNNDVVITSMLIYPHTSGPDLPDLPISSDISSLTIQEQEFYKQVIQNHRAEYFADLIFASYTGEAAIGFLKEFIPSNQPASHSHPSSNARYQLIDDFLNSRHNVIIDMFQNVLSKRGLRALSLRYSAPDLDSYFENVRPAQLNSDSELFGIFATGWTFLMKMSKTPSGLWAHLSENDIERISNDLIEKSIRNRMVMEGWNETANP
jgi:hypothetical protein